MTVLGATLIELASTLRKGQRVALTGRLQTRKWTDQSGATRYFTEVVVVGKDARLEPKDTMAAMDEGAFSGLDDDIPF